MSLPEPPSKKVIFTLLEKAMAAAKRKNMKFIQCIGDQPVYALMVGLKAKNPEKFALILAVLGAFHTQMAFMHAIYKRLQGSTVEDLLSEAGLTSGSVHKALQGKDYKKALRLYKLFCEAMARLLVKHGKK